MTGGRGGGWDRGGRSKARGGQGTGQTGEGRDGGPTGGEGLRAVPGKGGGAAQHNEIKGQEGVEATQSETDAGDARVDREPSRAARLNARGMLGGSSGGVEAADGGCSGGAGKLEGLDGDGDGGEVGAINGWHDGGDIHSRGSLGPARDGKLRESRGRVRPGTGLHIVLIQLKEPEVVGTDEGVSVAAIDSIHVNHHTGWPVEEGRKPTEELLAPAAHDGNFTGVFQEFLKGGAVTHKEEVSAPQVFAAFADAPTSRGSLANKAVVVLFVGEAFAGAKPDWAEAWAREGEFEVADPLSLEFGRSTGGLRGILRLHEDKSEAVFRNTGLELSYRARQGLEVTAVFRASRSCRSWGVQTEGGMSLR